MRVLLPSPAPDVDLHAFYAADWLETGGVRVNFVSSADGGAHAEGRSAGLQTPGDNRVFAALRDLADVVLVGAGTALAEKYRPASPTGARAEARRANGLAATLPIALTSRSLRGLDPALPLLRDATARTLVLTCASAPADARAALAEVADVIICGSDDISPFQVRSALAERGLRRILSEGGPTAFAALAPVVDELCLSLSPLLTGPGAGRIVAGAPWPDSRAMTLTGLLEEDGALFLRYRLAPPV